MRKLYKEIENWFIADYLESTPDVFEQSKIRLIYLFSLLSAMSVALSLPIFYSMSVYAFIFSFTGMLLLLGIPFLLRFTKSILISGKTGLTLGFINLVIIYFLLNRPDPMAVGGWFISIIIISSFILGKKWGFSFLVLSGLSISLMITLKVNQISLFSIGYDYDTFNSNIVMITTPVRAMMPMIIIYFVILEFLKSKNTTYLKLQNLFTDQKILIEKLKSSEEQYRRFIEEADDLIYMTDGSGRFTYANPAFEKVGGFELGELAGKNFNFFVKEEYKPILHKALIKQMKEEKELVYHEFPIVTKSGEEIWIGQKISMTFKNKVMVKAICISRDITKRKKAEEELILAKEEAIKASEAKADFLSVMSHEIRTPMNAVIGMTHLLIQDNPRPEQLENLKTLKFSGENLLTIINDVLDFSKIESGKLSLEETSFNLRYVVDSIYNAHSIKADDKHIKLLNNFDGTIPDFVVGDSVRLYQILNNLIGNAIKFTKEGHVIIQTTLRKVDKEGAVVDFSIMDTGIGIPKDKVDTIFENFTQASSSTTRNFGGTGLGLAITKKLLELQGSDIKVNSIFGKGSQFYFSLKFKKSTEIAPSEVGKRGNLKMSIETSLDGIKILLVEDNKINQLVAKKFISKWGADMDVAINGVEAIQMVKEEKYNVILMDLQMPVMGGLEASEKIRSLGGFYKDIPIIALTASAVLEVQDEAIAAGMNDFLTKPFDPQILLSKLKTYGSYSSEVLTQSQIPK